jgi:hypothetical protein
VLCIVLGMYVLFCVSLCIVVPLPPGTYPLAVNNNNMYNSNNHHTLSKDVISFTALIFYRVHWDCKLSICNGRVSVTKEMDIAYIFSSFFRTVLFLFVIDIRDHLYHCIRRSENFIFHETGRRPRQAQILKSFLSLQLSVMQSLSGFNTVALRGGSRMARPCRSGKIRSRK